MNDTDDPVGTLAVPASPASLAAPRHGGPDDEFARQLRGFGPVGIATLILLGLLGNPVVPAAGILVLLWARRSRTPFADIGFSRPRSWPRTVAIGIALGVAFKLAMKSVVMPLLGADPVNHAFHYLEGNRAALPFTIYSMIVCAGFGEETYFRGYLFERLGTLFGPRPWAKPAIVALTAALFGVAHVKLQGLAGAEQATIVGLVYGTIFAVSRSIWVPIVAHACFDLTALYLIYAGLETRVAHWFFR